MFELDQVSLVLRWCLRRNTCACKVTWYSTLEKEGLLEVLRGVRGVQASMVFEGCLRMRICEYNKVPLYLVFVKEVLL